MAFARSAYRNLESVDKVLVAVTEVDRCSGVALQFQALWLRWRLCDLYSYRRGWRVGFGRSSKRYTGWMMKTDVLMMKVVGECA